VISIKMKIFGLIIEPHGLPPMVTAHGYNSKRWGRTKLSFTGKKEQAGKGDKIESQMTTQLKVVRNVGWVGKTK